MGNCAQSKEKSSITVAVFGIDNAGKTSIAKSIAGEKFDEVAPTVGFENLNVSTKTMDVTLFDLGGGTRIRDIWKNYYAEIHGLIYVIDSSAKERIDENSLILSILLADVRIQTKPVLIFLNKQDVENAMDDVDATEKLSLETLVSTNKCQCRVETCVAKPGHSKKVDSSIKSGFKWLLDAIDLNYTPLITKVKADKDEQNLRLQQEKIERMERIRIIREQRGDDDDGDTKEEKPKSDFEASNGTSSYSNGHLAVSAPSRIVKPDTPVPSPRMRLPSKVESKPSRLSPIQEVIPGTGIPMPGNRPLPPLPPKSARSGHDSTSTEGSSKKQTTRGEPVTLLPVISSRRRDNQDLNHESTDLAKRPKARTMRRSSKTAPIGLNQTMILNEGFRQIEPAQTVESSFKRQ